MIYISDDLTTGVCHVGLLLVSVYGIKLDVLFFAMMYSVYICYIEFFVFTKLFFQSYSTDIDSLPDGLTDKVALLPELLQSSRDRQV
jgi:hypothetical protein